MLGRKSEEEKTAEASRKDQQRQEFGEGKRVRLIEEAKEAFFKTPAGRARLAYEQGDQVFQYAFDVVHHQAIVVAMVGSRQTKKTNDPVAVLNSVCHEGWELVNGSFVFVGEGSQSRDKFMSSAKTSPSRGPRSATTCSGVRTRTSARPRTRGRSCRPRKDEISEDETLSSVLAPTGERRTNGWPHRV